MKPGRAHAASTGLDAKESLASRAPKDRSLSIFSSRISQSSGEKLFNSLKLIASKWEKALGIFVASRAALRFPFGQSL